MFIVFQQELRSTNENKDLNFLYLFASLATEILILNETCNEMMKNTKSRFPFVLDEIHGGKVTNHKHFQIKTKFVISVFCEGEFSFCFMLSDSESLNKLTVNCISKLLFN